MKNIVILFTMLVSFTGLGKDFEITVIDSGVDFNVQAFDEYKSSLGVYDVHQNEVNENYYHEGANPEDWNHGTHVTGIIISHLNPNNADNNHARVNNIFYIKENPEDNVEEDLALERIKKQLEKVKPRVVNLSIGFDYVTTIVGIYIALKLSEILPAWLPKRIVYRRIRTAYMKLVNDSQAKWVELFKSFPNTLFVIAAGNDGRKLSKFKRQFYLPKFEKKFIEKLAQGGFKGFGADLATIELPNAITVGSFYGDRKKISSFSNTGRAYVDILADGQDVESYVAGGSKDKYSGTSMAAPQITGLAASLLQKDITLTAEELKSAIMKEAKRSVRFFGKSKGGKYFLGE